jgi:hypothetical protein
MKATPLLGILAVVALMAPAAPAAAGGGRLRRHGGIGRCHRSPQS